jgi:hypothetical protein
LPFKGYIAALAARTPEQFVDGSLAVAATQSAAHAASAKGLAKSTASGLMIAVSSLSCQSGSISVM